jgi:hypothetical protein
MTIQATEYEYSPGITGIRLQNITSGGVFLIPRDETISVIRDILKVYDDIY